MERMAVFVVEKRKYFLALFAAAVMISIVLAPMVRVNYDHTKYLPADMQTREAISTMEREFGLRGSAQAMVKDVSIPGVLRLKSEMERISGVKNVVWLDDMADVTIPLDFLDQDMVDDYYRDGNALFLITFYEDDHSLKTGSAIEQIGALNDGNIFVRGPAADAFNIQQTASSEILVITLSVIPIFLLILLIATNSWIEPVLFIATIGASVLINMGTNIVVGEISFITQTSASLLQFAVTMDYSIFLLHRFGEERAKGFELKQAITNALKKSFSTITASSLTTIAGFAALMFMRYSIGFDMGLVLVKGVVLSLLSVLLLLPALIVIFEQAVERTRHRPFMPNLKNFSKVVSKLRYVIPAIILLLLLPAFLAQGSNQFLYGGGEISGQTVIEDVFESYNPLVLMVPSGDIAKEADLSSALLHVDHVADVQALATLVDRAIPREMISQSVRDNFQSENYSRVMVLLNTRTEGEAAFAAVENIRRVADRYYPGQYWMLGSSAAISDIKTVVEYDFTITSMVAILAVGFILLITFRSLALPILLVFAIQSAIWFNMAIPYFTGAPLIFIGYMIVSAVQLGATIDYAILLTGRYMEERRVMGRREAAEKAISDSGNSIITSAVIMSAAGFTLGFISSVPSIAALGFLVGRGALLSCLVVLTFLPQLLMMGDGLIKITTLTHRFLKAQK